MSILLTILIMVLGVSAYADVLATISLIRDDTLTISGKLLRLVCVWLLPLVGALFVLRAAHELCPASLPTHKWLLPLRPILYVSRRHSSGTEPEYDMSQSLEQHHSGHHLD